MYGSFFSVDDIEKKLVVPGNIVDRLNAAVKKVDDDVEDCEFRNLSTLTILSLYLLNATHFS